MVALMGTVTPMYSNQRWNGIAFTSDLSNYDLINSAKVYQIKYAFVWGLHKNIILVVLWR